MAFCMFLGSNFAIMLSGTAPDEIRSWMSTMAELTLITNISAYIQDSVEIPMAIPIFLGSTYQQD